MENEVLDSGKEEKKSLSKKQKYTIIAIAVVLVSLVISPFLPETDNNLETPNVLGKTADDAERFLSKERFRNVAFETNIQKAHEDFWEVCAQTPKPREASDPKNTVVLYVSEDCRQMDEDGNIIEVVENVPNLKGMTLSEAKETILSSNEDAFHTITITEKDRTESDRGVWDSNNWIVCEQSVESDSEIKEDTTIELSYARDEKECESGETSASIRQKEREAERKKEEAEREKEEAEEENSSSETKNDTMHEVDARMKCEEALRLHDPTLKPRWRIGMIHKAQTDDGGWHFNVDVKRKGDTVGSMGCTVVGTPDKPVVEFFSVN